MRRGRISRLFFIDLLLTVNTLSNSSRFSTSKFAFLSSTASLATSSTTASTTSSTTSPTASPTNSSTTSSSTSSTIPLPGVQPLPQPFDDCEAVQPLYIIKMAKGISINATFDISCDTEFFGGDIMTFYSPSVNVHAQFSTCRL